MTQPKYVNIGFICPRCQRFLSVPESFPDGRYPAGSEFNVRCPGCKILNTFTPGDLELKLSGGPKAASGI